MYKDKKITIFNQIKRQKWTILSFLSVVIVFVWYTEKLKNSSSVTDNDLYSHRGIHSGHYLSDINYEEILKDVRPEYKERCKFILEGQKNIDPDLMWSLSFEDWFIYHNFFKHDAYHFHSNSDFNSKQKESFGVYLDIGDYRPYYQSNSAFFDLCLGWAGIKYIEHIIIY